jgi:hypothetical protein
MTAPDIVKPEGDHCGPQAMVALKARPRPEIATGQTARRMLATALILVARPRDKAPFLKARAGAAIAELMVCDDLNEVAAWLEQSLARVRTVIAAKGGDVHAA